MVDRYIFAKKIQMKHLHLFIALIAFLPFLSSQDLSTVDYTNPKVYEIGGITVKGNEFSDEKAIISVAGLKVGQKIAIPGGDFRSAIKSLWKLKLFTDIEIYKDKTAGDLVFIVIEVQERPRLSRYSFKGVKKSKHEDLNEVLEPFLVKGSIVTENTIRNAKNALLYFYREKGYLDAEVDITQSEDTKLANSVKLLIDIDRNDRVKIQNITFSGNESVKSRKLRRQMENTSRKWKIFNKSKFLKEDYKNDKQNIIRYYNQIGYRDANIVSDTVYREDDGDLQIHITIDEGNRYYFRNITWKGNSIHSDERLTEILGIQKGDVYNDELLETRLRFSQDGRDISTLYMDDGYLFFNVDPVTAAIENDSIDLEMRIYEGPQATIDRVIIKGNDRTHEHVIRRELRTRPGQKFSRSDIIRSQREIVNLGYFNPENLGINTPVNQQRGTVDIEYTVEERPSDQLELSAGWGGLQGGLIGTLGVSFNNFSLRNIDKRESWNPLPQGDGQKLSLRAQTNGKFFQSYNFSFTEPWLGGKKPNSFSVGGFYNSNDFTDFDRGKLAIIQLNIGLGTRLKWPDDNFISQTSLNIQNLNLVNYNNPTTRFFDDQGRLVDNGSFNNFSITQTIVRSSVNDPLFPRSGSKFSLSLQATLPYSLLRSEDRDYANESAQKKFKWLEYHKWRFDAEWYFNVFDKFVLATSVKTGILGSYNSDIGAPPFERFVVGGDGFSNQQSGVLGRDLISTRGYRVDEIQSKDGINPESPSANLEAADATVFSKYTLELRYPISLNPSSTIYAHLFAQGANSWRGINKFNPFDVRRSAGAGLRVFLPMFGMLGFDYGIGFDKPWLDPATSKWTDYGTFNIVLGFEPD